VRLPDPPLTDGELTLRPGRAQDAAIVTAILQDPEIVRWTRVPAGYRETDWHLWLDRAQAGVATGTDVTLLVVDAADTVLASVGLHGIDREQGTGEVGYWVAPHARGRGVAARAVRLLTAWAFDVLGLKRVEILVHVDNAPSRRAAERAGYERAGERRAQDEEGVERGLYEVLVSSR